MLTKEQVLQSITNMPEERFDDIDILLERLVMLEKIYTGLDQLDKGEGVAIDQLQKEMNEWDNWNFLPRQFQNWKRFICSSKEILK